MLLLDSLKVHKMGSVRAKLEEAMTGVDFVPAGATGLAQPMDVSVMRVFKHWCRELYVQHHITNDFSLNAKERRKLITSIVHEAWRAVPPPRNNTAGFCQGGPRSDRTTNGRWHVSCCRATSAGTSIA